MALSDLRSLEAGERLGQSFANPIGDALRMAILRKQALQDQQRQELSGDQRIQQQLALQAAMGKLGGLETAPITQAADGSPASIGAIPVTAQDQTAIEGGKTPSQRIAVAPGTLVDPQAARDFEKDRLAQESNLRIKEALASRRPQYVTKQDSNGEWYRVDLETNEATPINIEGTTPMKGRMPQEKVTTPGAGKTVITDASGNVMMVDKATGTASPIEISGQERQTPQTLKGQIKGASGTNKQMQLAIDKIQTDAASSRTVLGIAAQNNKRAASAMDILSKPKVTQQDLANAGADIAAIFKGGSPTDLGMTESDYGTLQTKIAKIVNYVTSNPQQATSPATINEMREVISRIKRSNDEVLNKNIDIREAEYGDVINSSPENKSKWDKVKSIVKGSKSINSDTAKQFLQQAGGDKEKARQLAKDAGYSF